MENLIAVMYGITVATAVFAIHSWYKWRQLAMRMMEGKRAQSQEPDTKEPEYKDSFEAQINALDDERRQIQVALTEAFDYLNDNGPFEENHNTGLMQVRNVLLRAISISTHGR